MRTLAQERAKFALNEVLKSKSIDKLKPFTAGAPTMILQNGFGQAIAFWLSKTSSTKEKAKFEFIIKTIREWLCNNKNSFINFSVNNKEEFAKAITQLSQKEYLSAQMETLKLLEWIKRYASAFCEDDNKEEK
jgi:CRISPR-associated protein Cmr5